jgi:hypothetical protein
VAYLGYDPDAAAEAGSGAPGAAGEDQVPIDAGDVANTLPAHTEPGLVDDLAKLVSVSASHTEFMRNALQIEKVKGDDELKKKVMDAEEGPWSVKNKPRDAAQTEAQPEAS